MTDTADSTGTEGTTDWQAWQDSWDRQQEWYMPDREERFPA
ncbi:methyltransferase [Streptomyces avidinii]